MAEKLIAGGAWVQVLITIDGSLQALGLAQGVSYDEDWGVQKANVLNYLGPISLDSQDYTCSINLNTFVPEKTITLYDDGGEITIEDLLPYRDTVQINGKTNQYDQLLIMNTAKNKVLQTITGVVVASNRIQVSPNAYDTTNMRFMALKRDKKV